MKIKRTNRIFSGGYNIPRCHGYDYLRALLGEPEYQDGFGLYWSMLVQIGSVEYKITATVSNIYVVTPFYGIASWVAAKVFRTLDEAYEHHEANKADDAIATAHM